MQKIPFSNLPNTTTPVNATNLNQMQENIDDVDVIRDGKSTIPSDADLNNYTTVGTYKTTSGSISSTLLNAPTLDVALKLIVERIHLSDSTRIRQTLIPNTEYSYYYVRTLSANGWGAWERISGLETITNANGTALKYADGRLICFNKKAFSNEACTTAFDGWYRTDALDLGNYPVAFASEPIINVTASGSYTGVLGSVRDKSTSAVGNVYFFRPSSTASVTFNIEYMAIGRWR